MKHFLTLTDLSAEELAALIDRAIVLKQMHYRKEIYEPLKNKVLAMIFEKASTRTRVSFEAAMIQFGGGALFLSPDDTQLGRGEPIADSAKVIASMVDLVMIRTYGHDKIEEFATHSSVPVINALTDDYHPCQLLADMMTYREKRGSIAGKTVTWIGDGNNMCHSYIKAAQQFNFNLHIAHPEAYSPKQTIIQQADANIKQYHSALEAAKGSDLIVTDVWASMGHETEQQRRIAAFSAFQVNSAVMAAAKPDALFMHCLPAHRGEEVSADVLSSSQSVVWQEAENRLHSQKALLEYLSLNC